MHWKEQDEIHKHKSNLSILTIFKVLLQSLDTRVKVVVIWANFDSFYMALLHSRYVAVRYVAAGLEKEKGPREMDF